MDLISIIIPIYNVEKYLDRCIESVISQTYSNLQIILVDDGSSDRCPEICDNWASKDNRITVIHKKNGGISSARNAGLAKAIGACVLQVDSDDYLAPFAIEHLLSVMEQTHADMVICDYVKGTEENYIFLPISEQKVEVIDNEFALKQIYSNDKNALKYVSPCKLCKRFLFEGILYPNGKIFEDIYTTHKIIFKCKKIAVIDEPLFYYYQRKDSIMNTKFHLGKLDYLEALIERVYFYEGNGLVELAEIGYDQLIHSLIYEYSRCRDVLHSSVGMEYTVTLFRTVYRKGYSSKSWPEENKIYLSVFNRNPELIVLYWKVSGKLKQIFRAKE